MKPGRGKAKGSAFEREICKKLSLWITDGKMDDCLWRSAISGGRATIAHRKGKVVRQGGDICAVSPEGHKLTDRWYIECKHVKKLGLDQFLVKGTGLLETFWKKCETEAHRHDKWPVIIAKQNGWPVLLITEGNFVPNPPPPMIKHESWAIVYLLDALLARPFERLMG